MLESYKSYWSALTKQEEVAAEAEKIVAETFESCQIKSSIRLVCVRARSQPDQLLSRPMEGVFTDFGIFADGLRRGQGILRLRTGGQGVFALLPQRTHH